MDDTNNKPSDISNQPSAEDANPVTPAAEETTASEESANPFGALKEFDVNPNKEGAENKEQDSGGEKAETTAQISAAEESEEKTEGEKIQDFAEAEEKTEEKQEEAMPEEAAPAETEEPKETEDKKPEPPVNPKARWYVVHTFAGHENKVATALKQRIEAERLENLIYDILVPTQDKIEIRGGKKETVKEKIFPGYILIKMELSDLSWLAVRTTQGVTSFIGSGNKPTPISEAEVATIVKFTTQGAAPTFKDVFMVDDTVKIIDGPFAEFIGKVDSVDKEKGRVRVLVSIFGRETPVELDFLQVQKL